MGRQPAGPPSTRVIRAMLKLGAHDRAQLVIATYEHGLVVPGEDGV